MNMQIRPTEAAAMKHAKRIAEAARQREYGRSLCATTDDPLLIEVGIEMQETADAILRVAYDEWDGLKRDRPRADDDDELPF